MHTLEGLLTIISSAVVSLTAALSVAATPASSVVLIIDTSDFDLKVLGPRLKASLLFIVLITIVNLIIKDGVISMRRGTDDSRRMIGGV
jgi:hypothetical protein